MNVLFVNHFYPPTPCGGAGYYTASIAEGLQRAGARVSVICAERWGEGVHYLNGFTDDVRNEIRIRRLHVNWSKAPRPLDWLYDSPVLGEQVQNFLELVQPDVVHFSSCYTLSTRPVFICKQLNLPIVMHLHDYWNICARHILLHKDGTICTGPESAKGCQNCLLAGTKVMQIAVRLLPEHARDALFNNLSEVPIFTRMPSLRGMLGNFERRRAVTIAAAEAADVLITPTHFARHLLEQNGIPAGRIRVLPYGNVIDWATAVNRLPSDRLRIGFLGNVISIKGVHVLIEAFRRLPDHAKVELQIWGEDSLEPAYCLALQKDAPLDVLWGGPYTRADLARILSNLDVVVVPSIWYETQGIVVQEAFAAGVPVIVSKGTSLTETVQHEENGLHFQLGSADDLARQLRRLLEEPALLPRLRAGIQPVRPIAVDIAVLQEIYDGLVPAQKATNLQRLSHDTTAIGGTL